ncbi:hypothetical protein H072_2938 [Dactylellina haptotyla CBS 200.50]|uniref:Uncharacterized protein n=1 Tax=Dactylellina haptotyla (strain CBS 200.50) TaxID=1284197 RepID=S8APM9_DACHA|nr:hypothetical protein H072_2938 [Dactylellina haptotyla CBS 200.50]
MRVTFLLVVAAAATSATPLPQLAGKFFSGAVNTIGLACAFQQEECQKMGDALKHGVTKVGGRPVDAKEGDRIMKSGLHNGFGVAMLAVG